MQRTSHWYRLGTAVSPYAALAALALGLALLGERHYVQTDLTRGARNTLSAVSRDLLRELKDGVRLTAYVEPGTRARAALHDLVERFRRFKPDIELRFVDPRADPDRTRELAIREGGELIVAYQGRELRLQQVDEESLSSALLRLARGADRWMVFLEGHGERDPLGQANHALGEFGERLRRAGLQLHRLNLARTPVLPDNTGVLVLAGAESSYLPGEVAMIVDFVRRGGNLLWLLEPDALAGLEPLARELTLRIEPGVVVDPETQRLGIAAPDFALIADFDAAHPATRGFDTLCLLPRAAALAAGSDVWDVTSLMRSSARSWTERQAIVAGGVPRYEPESGETRGPHDLGLALTRALSGGADQRIAVIGDGDFLSNAYLGNGGNLELGLNLANWLNGDDAFIRIRRAAPVDVGLEMPAPALIGFALVYLLVLPAALLGTGTAIWWRRKRR